MRLIRLICLIVLALTIPVAPANAQSCTTDFQCGYPPGGINSCLGDTLITRRGICSGGYCQYTEAGRQNCNPGGGAGTCTGDTFVRSGGRCDALSGRCTSGGASQITCVKTCACRGNRLVISTGMCTPGAGCGVAAFQCKTGCTCSPEPRCLEDPEPKPKRAVKDKKKS
jgi:hypothetical protein